MRLSTPYHTSIYDRTHLGRLEEKQLPMFDMYAILEEYYESNAVYDSIRQVMDLNGVWSEPMKGLRNPAHRVVEFYASKLLPGDSPHTAHPTKWKGKTKYHEPLTNAMELVWEWSNWIQNKQVHARRIAILGGGFLKCAAENNKVIVQRIDAKDVQFFERDSRGNLLYVEIKTREEYIDEYGRLINGWRLERWWKAYHKENEFETAYCEIYQYPDRPNIDMNRMEPTKRIEFPFDFIPIVYNPFREVGQDHGWGAFTHAISKIDECNRTVTRLHSSLFRYNKPLWLVSSPGSDDLYPVPALDMTNKLGMADTDVVSLPGGYVLDSLVPNIDWKSALDIVNAQIEEVEQDLPELKYYKLDSHDRVSGVALRYMLGDAVDRIQEARINVYESIRRVQYIALAIGQQNNIPGFSEKEIGTFANGDWLHTIEQVDVLPISREEKARNMSILTAHDEMPLFAAMRLSGYSQEDMDMVREEQERDRELKAKLQVEMQSQLPQPQQGNAPDQQMQPENKSTTADDQVPNTTKEEQ